MYDLRTTVGALLVAATLVPTVAGCGSQGSGTATGTVAATTSSPTGSPTAADAPHPSSESTSTGCGDWIGPHTDLHRQVVAHFGEIDDCMSLDHTWVLTTDRGSTGVGSIGIHACDGPCTGDVPTRLGQWQFYRLSDKVGTYSRLAGTTDHGSAILFVGGTGEVSFDPRTGTFSKPAVREHPDAA